MKRNKILLPIIILFLTIFIIPFKVNAEEKVSVYLFWAEGCPHCENAKDFFGELSKEYDYYELIEVEVSRSASNAKLLNDVSAKLNFKVSGVPFIVIGDEPISGFSDSIGVTIKNIIIEQYENKEFNDVVGDIIEEKEYDIISEENNYSIIIIFLILVTIFVMFYLFNKKK